MQILRAIVLYLCIISFALSFDKIGGTRECKIKNCVFILIFLSFALSLY